ncbi:MAG: hypothetical protein GXC72_08985 [Chitinophagaceae bacterium]|jgi:hypothetical protein|nr:hypothetical protein [Chitinophagaceae bacterium]
MRKMLFICLLAGVLLSCSTKNNHAETEQQLRETMTHFLYEKNHFDSSHVRYRIDQVIFFEDRDFYECEFTVHMQQAGLDTIGVMKARIAKDFSKVLRKL